MFSGKTLPIKENTQIVWDFDHLPFHVGASQTPENPYQLPNTAPLTLLWDAQLQRLWHRPTEQVANWLETSYREGLQIGTPLSENGLGRDYAEDFLNFIMESLSSRTFQDLRILEVGCGNGYLSSRLKALGADIIALEPGTQPSYTQAADVPVIQDFFRAELFDEAFDIILHYMVLEHIDDPLQFIRNQQALLKPDGLILSAVPDDSTYFKMADLSTIVHEHYSYFAEQSLTCMAQLAGMQVSTCTSAIGGALYSIWQTSTEPRRDLALPPSWFSVETFQQEIKITLETLQTLFTQYKDRRIGIYCPFRFLNYLPFFNNINFYFYDDDPNLHTRYFPPHPFPIQSRQNLLNDPIDLLLIMSTTFGPRLAEVLKDTLELKQTKILTIADIIG